MCSEGNLSVIYNGGAADNCAASTASSKIDSLKGFVQGEEDLHQTCCYYAVFTSLLAPSFAPINRLSALQ